MAFRKYQQKYQQAHRSRLDPLKRGVAHKRVMPPEAKILGDLEINIRFGLCSLSSKALVISKSISKVHIFLETTLEIGGRSHGAHAVSWSNAPPSGAFRAKNFPAPPLPGALLVGRRLLLSWTRRGAIE